MCFNIEAKALMCEMLSHGSEESALNVLYWRVGGTNVQNAYPLV